jgi:uncharacterized membrane protein
MQYRSLKLKSVAGVFFFVTLLGACTSDNGTSLYGPPVDCTQVQARFSADVMPIFQATCAYNGCHDAATGSGGVRLTSYDLIRQYSARIRDAVFVKRIMPKTGALTDAQRAKLQCWLDSGAPNN